MSSENRLTLKALANFSPGLRFGNPGLWIQNSFWQPFQGLRILVIDAFDPGLLTQALG